MVHNVNAKQLFLEAVEKYSPDQWPLFLDSACHGDRELRDRVEVLLRAHGQSNPILDGDRLLATIEQQLSERPGVQIGPYKLLQVIGEGGFGVVFMAEQCEPIRRKVALKVIKPGMDSRQVIARFASERQALAVMDHPNIAHVLDAGATESGRLFFVMELVRGLPITQYCDENHLSIRDRLLLFASVCQAIQHAHTKGIIHRDIKPNNVLVTRLDGRPVVKIIDFGVAKAISQQLTDRTLFTEFAQIIGTPLYMSPEQAELSSVDIDTRSDIYSLGVLLFELLTGSTPVHKAQMKNASFDEIRRIIREDEPPRPSSRISATLTAPSIATHRQSEAGKLARLIRGELDWIVMKALEKDRNRRYETAGSLAKDVECYLHDRPVSACPPSNWRRWQRLARRNKPVFIASLAMVVVVLVAIVALLVSNVKLRAEQQRTRYAKLKAEKAEILAVARAEQIQRDLASLKAANNFIQSGHFYTEGQHWLKAHTNLTEAIRLRPDHALGWFERAELYTHLGLWDLAVQDYTEGFKLHQPPMPRRWTHFALLSLYIGDQQGYRSICDRLPTEFNHEDKYLNWDEVLCRAYTLARLPNPNLEWALKLAKRGVERAPTKPWTCHALGTALYRAGDYEQAVTWIQESLRVDPNLGAKGANYAVLAMAYHRLGEFDESRQCLAQAAMIVDQWSEAIFRDSVGSTPYHWYDVGPVQLHWWDWMPCQVLYREAKLMIEGSPPREDSRLVVSRARAFAELGDSVQAAEACAKAAELDPDNAQIRLVCYHICSAFELHEQAAAHASAIGMSSEQIQTGQQQLCLSAHVGGAYSVMFSADGGQILSAGKDRMLRLWDAHTGDELRYLEGHERNVRRAVFAPHDSRCYSVGWDWTARVWDLESGRQLSRMPGHVTAISGLAVSSDGQYLLTAGGDHEGKDTDVRLWDTQRGAEVRRFHGHTKLVNAAAFSPDGTRVLTGSFDRSARVWDSHTGQLLHLLQGHQGPVTDVAFLPDGRGITCGFDWTIRLWNLETGQLQRQYVGHIDKVEAVAVAYDGRRIISAGHDGVIRVWDIETGRELARFSGHRGIVYGVAFSSDASRVASAGQDGTVRVWKLATP